MAVVNYLTFEAKVKMYKQKIYNHIQYATAYSQNTIIHNDSCIEKLFVY